MKKPLASVVAADEPLDDFAATWAPAIGRFVAASTIVPLRLPYRPPAARAGSARSAQHTTNTAMVARTIAISAIVGRPAGKVNGLLDRRQQEAQYRDYTRFGYTPVGTGGMRWSFGASSLWELPPECWQVARVAQCLKCPARHISLPPTAIIAITTPIRSAMRFRRDCSGTRTSAIAARSRSLAPG